LADPSLKHHAIDWFDGEKVGIEICAGLLLALGVWPLRRALAKFPSHFTSEVEDDEPYQRGSSR